MFLEKNTKLGEKNASKLIVVTSLGCVIMKIMCFFSPSFNASVCYNEHVLILQSEKITQVT